jgi:hypothetical protein
MKLSIQGIPSQEVDRIRRGGNDANGQPALRRRAEVLAGPCRHCLGLIAEGQEKLILAYRPFDAPQPYAETGPIFLHGGACERYRGDALPCWFRGVGDLTLERFPKIIFAGGILSLSSLVF